MNFFKKLFIRAEAPEAPARPTGIGAEFTSFNDSGMGDFLRAGGASGSNDLSNMAVLRCVSLISNSIGMLPINLFESGDDKKIASDKKAHGLLKRRPNDWLTPYEFKALMTLNVITQGNSYARVIWSRGEPLSLIPLDSKAVEPKLNDKFQMEYKYSTPNGGSVTLKSNEILHLRDISTDGVTGQSRTKLAQRALELAKNAEESASRVFKTGVMAGGAVEIEHELKDEPYRRLRESLDTRYSGAQNINRWMLLEDGAKAKQFSNSSADAQQVENRSHQIEEVARLFGVPRPLLMMDDTSWGSGIEQLAIFFVQYTLAPWFVVWEQALARVLLPDEQIENYYFKFNERALLRGTLKDQAEYFAKALGSGGHQPWMTGNEVRDLSEMPKSNDPSADKFMQTTKGKQDEPVKTA